MERSITIVTDSTADVPDELLTRYEVHTIPLTVNIDDQSYLDKTELTAEEFYPLLGAARRIPSTSQPSPGSFEALYAKLLAQGRKVISIHLSSKLSGTFSAAVLAQQNLISRSDLAQDAITIVDSLSVTMGLGWQVIAAAEAAALGRSREEILKVIEMVRERVKLFVSLDTLEYLHKGGRIGAAQAFIGTVLHFKPMVQVLDGVVVPFARLRSRGQAFQKNLELVEEAFRVAAGVGQQLRLAIVHAHALAEAQKLRDELMSRLHFAEEPILVQTGPVLGIHTGPGALGVAFY